MRYTSSVISTMPMFLIAIIWGAVGLPALWIALSLLSSVVVGFTLGYYMIGVIKRFLFTGKSHFMLKRAPGGIWFFLGLGLLGGCGGGLLAVTPTGLLILRACAVVFGAITCVMFGISAIAVMRLERAEGKLFCMGPSGFYLEE